VLALFEKRMVINVCSSASVDGCPLTWAHPDEPFRKEHVMRSIEIQIVGHGTKAS